MRKNRFNLKPLITAATLTGLLSGSMAFAHPGHSLTEATPTHLLTSPDHFFVLVMSGVLLILSARFVQRQIPRRLMQSAGILSLVAAVVIRGLLA